jgi:hypothetical protein
MDQLRLFARQIVQTVTDGRIAEAVERFSDLTHSNAESKPITTQSSSNSLPATLYKVGIWQSSNRDGPYTRCAADASQWSHWRDIEEIPKKGSRQRIVLLGESVARGYLYDPTYAASSVLSYLLWHKLPKTEVVDLAKIGIGLEIGELAKQALYLDPDLLVVFAGNNWMPRIYDQERQQLAQMLSEKGVWGYKNVWEEYLKRDVALLVRDISQTYENAKLPILWVIPETNLRDWRDPSFDAPVLAQGQLGEQWENHRDRALDALKHGDITAAQMAASTMLTLDQGISAVPFQILGRCAQMKGSSSDERLYLEKARDAGRWDGVPKGPRTHSIIQTILRELLVSQKANALDLSALIQEYEDGVPPGRRLFLDYCHFNSLGIRLVMSAIAAESSKILHSTTDSWRGLIDSAPIPSAQTEAEATFLAAIHNAHWYQAAELVFFYCSTALKIYPQIATAMACFVEMQLQRLPVLMSKGAYELSKLGFPLINRYLLRPESPNLDRVLVNTLTAILSDHNAVFKRSIAAAMEKPSVKLSTSEDLLDYYHCAGRDVPEEVTLRKHERLARASEFLASRVDSSFWFVMDRKASLILDSTLRLPSGRSCGAVAISINGSLVETRNIDDEWEHWILHLNEKFVVKGLNEISILWPAVVYDLESELEKTIHRLLLHKSPSFYPIYGEIISLYLVAQ